MQNNDLRRPLINSAVLLIIFSLLVYFASTSAEGSVWNALAMILNGVFRAAQLGVGLVLALVFCLVVLCGIFLGAVAIVSKQGAAKMCEYLKQMVRNNFLCIQEKITKDQKKHFEELKTGISVFFADKLNDVKKNQAEYYLQFKSVAERLRQLELSGSGAAGSRQLESLSQEFVIAKENIFALQAGLREMQASCQDVDQQLKELSPEILQGDLPQRLSQLEKTARDPQEIKSIKQQMESLQMELDRLKARIVGAGEHNTESTNRGMVGGAADAQQRTVIRHRLCEYLPNQEDCMQLAEIVNKTLDKRMTYAQVIEFVMESLSEEAAETVGAHPSLLKDYVRQVRKANQ